MIGTHRSYEQLSDDQLIAEVKRLAAAERRATATLVRALMELDARRLYLGEGCSSLFTYCTQVLHLSESAAYNRIEAARAARRFPPVIESLEAGALTLTAARLLAPHLTTENCRELLVSARHKSKTDVERLIASLRPEPVTVPSVRKLPAPRRLAVETPAPPVHVSTMPSKTTAAMTSSRPVVVPVAPERYKVQLTITGETRQKLERVEALVRHMVPSADLAEIFDRALTLLLKDLERRRCAATPAPRSSNEESQSRYVPAAVKREVWRRDEGRCAFIGREGRCKERSFLEFHHVRPYAVGGVASVANIELRCRAHNAYEASLFFGETSPVE